eukprot:350001-Chlamydomonas_euryale.AAC.10
MGYSTPHKWAHGLLHTQYMGYSIHSTCFQVDKWHKWAHGTFPHLHSLSFVHVGESGSGGAAAGATAAFRLAAIARTVAAAVTAGGGRGGSASACATLVVTARDGNKADRHLRSEGRCGESEKECEGETQESSERGGHLMIKLKSCRGTDESAQGEDESAAGGG